jgi:uncharacterized protein
VAGATSMFWRRLDMPGHDACRLDEATRDWRVDGTAVFRDQAGPAVLAYHVEGDAGWRTREARVRGWIGERSIDTAISRMGKSWNLDGVVVSGLERCIDLDLGFTPATNLIPIRRLALEVGHAADVPAAWLDVATGVLKLLEQRYERRGETVYWYEAPAFGYTAELDVAPTGFVRRYPGLWESI